MLSYHPDYTEQSRNVASTETKVNWVKDIDKFESRLTTTTKPKLEQTAAATRDNSSHGRILTGHVGGMQVGSRAYYDKYSTLGSAKKH